MKLVEDLKVKLFADGADRTGMLEMYRKPMIRGFTTNPTLMRKAGTSDYEAFARDILAAIPDRPVSLEVFADDFMEMERQALKISKWGSNVYTQNPGHEYLAPKLHAAGSFAGSTGCEALN